MLFEQHDDKHSSGRLVLPAGSSLPLHLLDGFSVWEGDNGQEADLRDLDLDKHSIVVKGHVLAPTGRPGCPQGCPALTAVYALYA